MFKFLSEGFVFLIKENVLLSKNYLLIGSPKDLLKIQTFKNFIYKEKGVTVNLYLKVFMIVICTCIFIDT